MSDHDEVVIRRAAESDVPAIVALLADDEIGVGRESPGDLTPYLRAFKVIESDAHELLVVAERAGTVVGTLQLSLLPGLARKGALRAQIEAVRIVRDERGTRSERVSSAGPSTRRVTGPASWSNSPRTRRGRTPTGSTSESDLSPATRDSS